MKTLNFEQLITKFEKSLRDEDRAELTVRAYLVDVRNFAAWWEQTHGEQFDLTQVTPTDGKDYRSHLQSVKQQKASSINRRRAALSAFFDWGVRQEWIGRNPLSGLKSMREQATAPRWLEPRAEYYLQQVIEQWVQIAPDHALSLSERMAYRNAAMMVLMLKAGLRISEVAALNDNDVELHGRRRGTGHIRAGKGRKSRDVPLNTDVAIAVDDWRKVREPQKAEALFLSKSNIRITARAIQQIVEQLGREAAAKVHARSAQDREIIEALNALTPHVLRHSCAKRLLDAGAQLTEVAAILGHENLNTTRRYVQPGAVDLQRAADRISTVEQ